jgi:hypothetical protein
MTTKILDADGNQANGNGTTGMPWQVRAIGFFGVPSAIAIFLVYVLAADVRSDATSAAVAAAAMRTELAQHQKHTEMLHQNIEEYMRTQLLLMRRMCSHAARTSSERDTCFQP